MAGSYNRVILMGNITRDIDVRFTPGGTAVTDLGLAVNEKRKGSDGQMIEETVFVDVTLWGRNAEVAGEYLQKGSPILIEGRLKLDQWEAEDGGKRQKLKVVCDRMQMLGSKSSGGNGGGGGGGNAQAKPQSQAPSDGGGDNEDDEAVPF